MVQTLYFIRHAQGYHNLCQENHKLRDPQLTDLGHDQCKQLQESFPYSADVDLIVVSPIKRTIYTALYSFERVIKERNIKIVALPELQETSDLPCDTGSPVTELEKEFAGHSIDFSNVPENWESNEGKWAPLAGQIAKRARDARQWLRNRPEQHIVVVTHGSFLHYFTDDWYGIQNFSAGSGWANTEWRSYNFIPESGENASVQETQESRNRRKGFEHPLSEAEQRNLREVAVKTWEDLGYIRSKEPTTATARPSQTKVSA